MNLNELKNELLCLGAKFEGLPDRIGGAGPSDAIFMRIENIDVSIPLRGEYVKSSPFSLKKINGDFLVLKNNRELFHAERIKEPEFYKKVTPDGIPYRKIFLAHGKDCIGTTVFQSCIYWNTPSGCKFCATGLSLKNNNTIAVKKPEDIFAVAISAVEENFSHAVLTTGSQRDEINLINHLSDCVKLLKKLPLMVQVQVSPPENISLLERLKGAGTDTIAINIESFDENVLRTMAPRKAEIGLKRYFRTMEFAVQLFGENQVISFVLAGLGENKRSIIEGAKKLSSIGVYPFIVPLRPIPETPLAYLSPPSPAYLKEIYSEVTEVLKEYNLSYKKILAGCGRCTCCSALPDYEE